MDDHSRALGAVIVGACVALAASILADPRLSDAELVIVRGVGIVALIAAGTFAVVVTRRRGPPPDD
jgi:hypothetical protein